MAVPVIDSHAHFVDPDRFSYPGFRGFPSLCRRRMPEDFSRAGGDAAERCVFVEVNVGADQHLAEARWASELARRDPRIAAIVAALPIELGGGAEMDLDELCALPRLRGIRRLFENHPDPDFCLRRSFADGLRMLTERRLPFDICVRQHQLESVVLMCRRAPDQVFVLDHMGKPDVRHGGMDGWATHVAELAKLGNVTCKISGIVTEADPALPLAPQLAPYVEHVLACFGYDRVMFGSDWHVLELASGYGQWLDLVRAFAAHAAEDEQRQLFGGTCALVYRLAA